MKREELKQIIMECILEEIEIGELDEGLFSAMGRGADNVVGGAARLAGKGIKGAAKGIGKGAAGIAKGAGRAVKSGTAGAFNQTTGGDTARGLEGAVKNPKKLKQIAARLNTSLSKQEKSLLIKSLQSNLKEVKYLTTLLIQN